MKTKERVSHKYVVNYEPVEGGPEEWHEEIEPGIQGEFESREEANEAAKKCDLWFNKPTKIAYRENAETGRTVPVKEQQRLKNVRIWIEHYKNGELVEDESCEESPRVTGKRRNTSSTEAAQPVGSA